MDNERRLEIYLRPMTIKYSGGYARLTPKQRRRIRKKDIRPNRPSYAEI